jgi:coenzyme F420-0:L-glutamate ligase/coenzyme F420-1:gamma-L-glutamate ligase
VLDEASAVVRAAPEVLITRHRTGHVMANSGIDRSNLGPDGGKASGDRVLLLPADADATAAGLRSALAAKLAEVPAVVISDSFGRPWRIGTINVAIGAAGMPAVIDQRGESDRDGRLLQVSQVALADMVASAAGLVAGEAAEGIPAVLVRGLDWTAPEAPAAAILRPEAEDLFR